MCNQSVHQFRKPRPRATGPVLAAGMCLGLLGSAAQGEILEFVMTLDGSQEDPPVMTSGAGSGTATLDTVTRLFSWNITFSGLSAAQTAAHFHATALQCESAGVVITLPNGSPIVGSQILTAQQATDVQAGRWYVNVHTTAHSGGEIRGQVMPPPLDDPIPGPIRSSPVHVQLETVSTGLTAPNWGAAAPGDSDRLFVTDQPGTLWAVDLDTGTRTAFLDATGVVVPMGAFGPGSFDERGLLGVAFHPDYQKNGLLYTYTSEPVSGPADFSTIPVGGMANHQTVIREWQVPDPTNPASVVDPGSTRVLLRIDSPQFNHNAGCINFGPDGLLYFTIGDGGAGDDQGAGHACDGNGQNFNTILGAIIRINPLGTDSANGEYGIPPTNPFVGVDGIDEIYAYGLRNPFRFSFDSVTGDLYLGDVGQNDIEEVNIITSGGNYGWNHKEGSFFFVRNGSSSGYVTNRPLAGPTGLIDPIAEYDHDEGISVIGGFVYRGSAIPPLAGRYVFGEFGPAFDSDGRLFHLGPGNEILEFDLGPKGVGLFVLGFGQDADGELYLMANSTGVPFMDTGVVLRIRGMSGDINFDGVVDGIDLGNLLANWSIPAGSPGCGGALPCVADIDGNGVVDGIDLGILLANWTL